MALMTQNPTSPGPEPKTIEQLFDALESPLLSYACRLAGDPGVAEDIVQEAFMKLHEQFDDVREPRRWLYRAVHNAALNHRRRAGKIISLDLPVAAGANETVADELPDTHSLPDEEIARWESVGLVRLTLETLDERSRELVRLKFEENLSYKEISACTGLKVGHVGYLLHHALKGMADELAKNGIVP